MSPFAHEKSSELNLKTLPYLNQRAINNMKKIIRNSFDWLMLHASLNYMQVFKKINFHKLGNSYLWTEMIFSWLQLHSLVVPFLYFNSLRV